MVNYTAPTRSLGFWAILGAFTGETGGRSPRQLTQVVRCHVRTTENPDDEPRLERVRTVNWNRRSASVGVTHDVMRSLDVLELESGTLKRADQFSAAEARELGRH